MQQLQLSPTQRLAKAYIDLGVTMFNQGSFAEAIAYFQQAREAGVDLNPAQQARLDYNTGSAALQLGNSSAAIQYFQAALQNDPQLTLARMEIAKLEYAEETQSKGYRFSQDWFGRNIPLWREQLQELVGRAHLNVLEVGTWEGRSACWLLENVLTHDSARITCVDSFEGNPEYRNTLEAGLLESVEARFDFNIQLTGAAHKVTKQVGQSSQVLRSLPLQSYDLIYIDGSHFCRDVLSDAVLSWDLLKVGGLMIFDDYDFGLKEYETQLAIDAFLACFAKEMEGIHKSHQVIIRRRKTADT